MQSLEDRRLVSGEPMAKHVDTKTCPNMQQNMLDL